MTKLRSFLAGLLLVPVLALNAGPLLAEADGSSLEPPRPALEMCWIFYYGRWILIPC